MGALWTDLYELKMAASYLRRAMAGPATFSLFVRHLPPERGYLVAAGLADCLSFLESFGFTSADPAYLRDVHDFDEPTLKALAGLKFRGDVWAVPEGHFVFAQEPLIEVTAPIAEGQLLETYLLNQMTFQTSWVVEFVDIAKFEWHLVDGAAVDVCVHRKGATRAVPPGHPDVPAGYRAVGQPVMVPGDMGRCFFVAVGATGSMTDASAPRVTAPAAPCPDTLR